MEDGGMQADELRKYLQAIVRIPAFALSQMESHCTALCRPVTMVFRLTHKDQPGCCKQTLAKQPQKQLLNGSRVQEKLRIDVSIRESTSMIEMLDII